MGSYPFQQVDVFGSRPLSGNPLAVVLEADGLGTEAMQALARWTGLSETTFLLEPDDQEADYRVRIFTPQRELPFAGHPTLGSAYAWLSGVVSRSDPRPSSRSAGRAWSGSAGMRTGWPSRRRRCNGSSRWPRIC